MNAIELSIIMPCLNESETIEQCIINAQRFFNENNVSGEIVIGDNGSTDGSIDIARKAGARVVHVEKKGYGSACIGAIKASTGKYIIMGDSDLSYDFYNLMPFVTELRNDFDLVMGNRFKGGIKPGAMPFKNRYLGNPVLSLVGRVLFTSEIGDFHCGLRGFSRKAFDELNVHTTGMEFASELVFKAQLMKLKTIEVPTVLSKDGRSGKPHLRPWRDGWRHLRLMFLFSPNHLFTIPGYVLIGLGLILMTSIISFGSIEIGNISLSISSLVYASGFVIAGLQAILFGSLAKYYGVREKTLPFNQEVYSAYQNSSIEKYLLVGAALIIVSAIGMFYSLSIWSSNDFGALVPMDILSVVVPSVVGFVIGFELILFGFLVGVINLKQSPWDK